MPFELTNEFLNQLTERAAEQDQLELGVLCARLPDVKERWEQAVAAVREKVGTLDMHCTLLALAYLEPSVLLEAEEPKKIERDSETFLRAFLAAEERGGYLVLSRVNEQMLWRATRDPSFVTGLVLRPAPTDLKGYFHIDHILPGLGNVIDREPDSVGDLLTRIHFRQTSNPNLPNHVSPCVPIQSADKVEGISTITLYFSKEIMLSAE